MRYTLGRHVLNMHTLNVEPLLSAYNCCWYPSCLSVPRLAAAAAAAALFLTVYPFMPLPSLPPWNLNPALLFRRELANLIAIQRHLSPVCAIVMLNSLLPVVEPESEPAVERVAHHPLAHPGHRVEQPHLAPDEVRLALALPAHEPEAIANVQGRQQKQHWNRQTHCLINPPIYFSIYYLP